MDEIWYADVENEDDFYEILGCNENSTTDQINAEYKVLARELHPDKRPNDAWAAEKFNKVQKARDVLVNSETRADYDKWKRSGLHISYDMWLATRESTHVSLHWALKKYPQQALEDSNQPTGHDDGSFYRHPPSKNSEAGFYEDFGWHRDTGDEIIRKFRTYQI